MVLTTFSRGNTTNQLGTILQRLFGMKGTLCTSKTLTDYPRVLINQYRHVLAPLTLAIRSRHYFLSGITEVGG